MRLQCFAVSGCGDVAAVAALATDAGSRASGRPRTVTELEVVAAVMLQWGESTGRRSTL